MKKTLGQVLRAVDPNLKIVPGGTRHGENWSKSGGAICPGCGQEAVWLRPRDGLCRQCARALDEKFSKDKSKHTRFLKQMKAHNARIGKGKQKRDV